MKTHFYKLFVFMLLGFFVVSCAEIGDSDSHNSLPPLPDKDDVCSAMDDINFMKYCYENFDVNKDGKVSPSEAKA